MQKFLLQILWHTDCFGHFIAKLKIVILSEIIHYILKETPEKCHASITSAGGFHYKQAL